jgi:hypothetical protein
VWGDCMARRCALYSIGLLSALLLVADPDDDRFLPLWCGSTAQIVASLEKQSFVSRRRAEIMGRTHEWFVGPFEVIVLEHNADGTSCIAAEGPWPPPVQARP